MRILLKLLVLAVVLAALWVPANAAPTITATLTNAAATGSESIGQCPQTFNFTGTIDARAWPAGSDRIVEYRFEGIDGVVEMTHMVIFPEGGGSKTVAASWTQFGKGTYWAQLHILKPIDVLSNKSSFSTHCI
jgi:hypothetical protein